jgi:hypothetical protein
LLSCAPPIANYHRIQRSAATRARFVTLTIAGVCLDDLLFGTRRFTTHLHSPLTISTIHCQKHISLHRYSITLHRSLQFKMSEVMGLRTQIMGMFF